MINLHSLYPALTVTKSFSRGLGGKAKMNSGKISARKCPIGSTNLQWDEELPLKEVSLYLKSLLIQHILVVISHMESWTVK